MTNAVKDGAHSINLIRSLLNRALVIDPSLHTGYILTGPPGSGKSTLVSLLPYILGHLSASYEARDLQTSFNRHELAFCHLAVFNEIDRVSATDEKFLKLLQGRDPISSNVKNVQGHFSSAFKGTCILTSNMPPEILIGGSKSMSDRFLCINFVTRRVDADNALMDRLRSNIYVFITWGLTLNKDINEMLTRANPFNILLSIESHDIVQFAQMYLAMKPGNKISVEAYYKKYKTFVEDILESNGRPQAEFKPSIVENMYSVFNEEVGVTRSKVDHLYTKRNIPFNF